MEAPRCAACCKLYPTNWLATYKCTINVHIGYKRGEPQLFATHLDL